MANDFYQATGSPSTRSSGSSSTMRAEFAAIEDAFDKLPALSGNADEVVVVDAGGNALTTKAFSAENTANTPTGSISSTTVQDALNELDTEKAPKATPTLTGTVYLPGQPRCVASRNNAAFETMAGDTSFGILGALHVNVGGFYAGALVGASGSALHAPVTGYYKVDLMAYFQSLSNSGRLFVLKNNTTTICLGQHASITGDESSFSSGIIHLTAGDYINFKTGLADIIVNNTFPYTYVNITFLG